MIQSLARKIEDLLQHLFQLSIRFPKRTIGLVVFIVVACQLPMTQLRMLMDTDELIDSDFETYKSLWSLKETFLEQDKIYLLIRHQDGRALEKKQLCDIRHWLQSTADSGLGVRAIVSSLAIGIPKETANSFKIPPLLDLNCADQSLDETDKIRQYAQTLSASPWAGTLVAKDGSDVGVLLYPDARTESSFFGTFNSEIIDELKSSFDETVLQKNQDLVSSWTGDSIFHYYLKEGYQSMPALNLLMSLLIVVFFRIFFGVYRSSFIFLGGVAFISTIVYAGMAIAGHPIDVLSSSLSLMIFVSSLEDFLFLMHRMKTEDWKTAFSNLMLPSFFTSLTTTVGFGSLLLADLEIVQRFGLWAAVASLIEWIAFFVFLPAFLQVFSKMRILVLEARSFKIPTGFLVYKPSRILTYAGILVFPLGLYSSQKLYVSDSPERLLEPEHEARQALDLVEQTRGWRAEVSLVFADAEKESFNRSALEQVAKNKHIIQTEDIYSTQNYLTENLSPSMNSFYRQALEDSTLGKRLGPSEGQARAMLYVKSLDIQDVNKMRQEVKVICPRQECWLAGSLVSYGELSEKVLTTLYKSLGGSLILVSLIIWFLCMAYTPGNFFPLILSAMWGPMALLCVFFIFDIPVFYITSMIASILVGLAGDNAIHFIFNGRKEELETSVTQTAPASFLTALGMMLCSSLFYFGYFDPMKTLGTMLVVGIGLSFLGDVWILRGLHRKT